MGKCCQLSVEIPQFIISTVELSTPAMKLDLFWTLYVPDNNTNYVVYVLLVLWIPEQRNSLRGTTQNIASRTNVEKLVSQIGSTSRRTRDQSSSSTTTNNKLKVDNLSVASVNAMY